MSNTSGKTTRLRILVVKEGIRLGCQELSCDHSANRNILFEQHRQNSSNSGYPNMASFTSQGPKRLGTKQVFLPNFTLTLLRTPKLPPTYASFLVPLNLNKLDLRDYLWNAYNIRSLSVRSYIQMQKLRQDKPGAKRPSPRKWYRPRSIKKMTVEMDRPFVWPEEPTDYEKWDKKTYDAAQEARTEEEEMMHRDARQKPSRERKSIAQQARQLLADAERRTRGESKSQWENIGEEVEVETNVEIPHLERIEK
ncbi:hypothetical protein B0O99DRAFT_646678 [Bisporella sp. PMI_857]|nr:hypothetical protein B0O99DRAFT_646678 [Bisporella sp. PMI_857]